MANLKSTTIDSNGYLKIPYGTSDERPTEPLTGTMRLNTDFGKIEIWDGSAWLGTAYTFDDNFLTNTLSQYTITTSAANPDPAFTWLGSGQVFLDGADNQGCGLIRTSGSNTFPTSGKIFKTFQKTTDYPTDNSHQFHIRETADTRYYVYFSGSNYQPSLMMSKIVNGLEVDNISVNNAVDFDDETQSHTFEFHYSPTKLEFYLDGVLVGSGNTTNNYTIVPVEAEMYTGQVDGYLGRFGVTV